jgi:hypothetical protein
MNIFKRVCHEEAHEEVRNGGKGGYDGSAAGLQRVSKRVLDGFNGSDLGNLERVRFCETDR